jgi:hypothetical protein
MTTTEIAVVHDAELVDTPAPLSEGQARALDKRIRAAHGRAENEMNTLLTLIQKADEGQIWVALGLHSMSEYLKGTVQITPKDATERKALSEALGGKGFSQRITAAILNTSQTTVSRDLSESNESLPPNIEGADGRTYKRKTAKDDEGQQESPLDAEEVPLEPEPEPEVAPEPEPVAKPQPVSKDFRDEMGYLDNTVQSFKDILDDPRFPKAAKTIAKNHLNDLQENIVELNKIVDCLMETS